MRLSVHIGNEGKDILILGKGTTQRLNHTLTSETPYSINFTRPGIKFCCIIMGATVSYLFMLQKYISSKQKTEIKKISLVFREYFRRFFS